MRRGFLTRDLSGLVVIGVLVGAISCSAAEDDAAGRNGIGGGSSTVGVGAVGGFAAGGAGGTGGAGDSGGTGGVTGGSGGTDSLTGGAGGTGGATGGTGGTIEGTGGATEGTGGTTGGTGGGGTGGGQHPDLTDSVGFATLNGGTTGGLGGETVTATTYDQLKSYAESSGPLIIMVKGTITNGSGGGHIRLASNKSIIGIGSTAFLDGVGLEAKNSNNIIVQNIKATLVGVKSPTSVNGGDIISINGTSKNIWIDHCELYSEPPHIQTDKDKYDGLIDIKHQTGYITVSWSYLHDHHKGCLIGASEKDLYADRKVTFHHNRFERVVKRMPMMRGAVGHFFNNHVVGARNSSGSKVTEATFVLEDVCLRVEKNVYEDVKYSIYTGSAVGRAERIDNVAPQSRAYPGSCTADIPYDYASALTTNTSDVPSVVIAGAGVGKI